MGTIGNEGFEVRHAVFDPFEIELFRAEVDRLASSAKGACVRLLAEKSDLFRELATSEVIRKLIENDLTPVRSILFDKTEEENWPVLWHQDLTITVTKKKDVRNYRNWSQKNGVPHVQPPLSVLEQMVTLRIHLDPTPAENGALRIIPGSHLSGRMDQSSIRDWTARVEPKVCACEAGDVLLMSPLILHSSPRSAQPSRRRILHFEFAIRESLDSMLRWYEKPPNQ
ncbi:MAG: phytanoyl-CoA dioxygenase family protein [Verrucomicrobiota bacterium]